MANQTTSKGLSCPHCNQAIPMPLLKSLYSIKTCPSCHKGVRYRKPAFKQMLSFMLMVVPIVVVLAVILFVMGVPQPIIAGLSAAVSGIFATRIVNKHASFDKTE